MQAGRRVHLTYTSGIPRELGDDYLKATVILGKGCDSSLGRNLHPPIDRTLLRALAGSKIQSRHKREWKTRNWTQLTRLATTK